MFFAVVKLVQRILCGMAEYRYGFCEKRRMEGFEAGLNSRTMICDSSISILGPFPNLRICDVQVVELQHVRVRV